VILLALYFWLQLAIEDSLGFLNSHLNEEGAVILNGDERFKVWENANILYALSLEGDLSNPLIDKVSHYLLTKGRKRSGAFSYKECPDCSNCIETSSVAYIALKNTGKIKELEDKRDNRYLYSRLPSSGKWQLEYLKEDEPYFPSATGFGMAVASRLLPLNQEVKSSLEKSFSFLVQAQNKSGDWGISDNYYGSYFYGIYAVLWGLSQPIGLKENEKEEELLKISLFDRALDFVIERQTQKGNFIGDNENTGSPFKISPELHTALALNALLLKPRIKDSWAILKGIYWLLKRQTSEGSWKGGIYPYKETKKEDLYATASALSALIAFKSLLFL
tara:strand:+ start:1186 stop:2184 length:999 start_codon:yes stop_codon:yes gene_type:complete